VRDSLINYFLFRLGHLQQQLAITDVTLRVFIDKPVICDRQLHIFVDVFFATLETMWEKCVIQRQRRSCCWCGCRVCLRTSDTATEVESNVWR